MLQTKNSITGLLAVGLILTFSPLTFGNETAGPATAKQNVFQMSLSIGTEILDGDTTYRIGYPVTIGGVTSEGYFPFSEMVWPLDIAMGRIDGSITLNDSWKFNGTLKKNITDPGGHMEDSDWTTSSNPTQLDVYSESNISDFSAFIFDFDVEYTFASWDIVSLFGGIGYQYQEFDFDSQLINQYSPSGLPSFGYTGDGRVAINYGVSYQIPYLLLGADLQSWERFSLKGSIAFAPYVSAQDEDNHLLREYGGKITRSDMDGTGIMFDISGKFNFTPLWFIEFGLNTTKVDVEGTMNQGYVWFGNFGSNKVEAESTQSSGYIALGASF